LGGVATKPWRVPEAEQTLRGQTPDAASFSAIAELALAGRSADPAKRLQDRTGQAAHRRVLTDLAYE